MSDYDDEEFENEKEENEEIVNNPEEDEEDEEDEEEDNNNNNDDDDDEEEEEEEEGGNYNDEEDNTNNNDDEKDEELQEEEGENAIDDNEREDEEEDNNKDVEDDNNEGPKEQGERKTSTKELNPNAPPSPEQINKFCNNILRFQHNKDFTIFKNVIADHIFNIKNNALNFKEQKTIKQNRNTMYELYFFIINMVYKTNLQLNKNKGNFLLQQMSAETKLSRKELRDFKTMIGIKMFLNKLLKFDDDDGKQKQNNVIYNRIKTEHPKLFSLLWYVGCYPNGDVNVRKFNDIWTNIYHATTIIIKRILKKWKEAQKNKLSNNNNNSNDEDLLSEKNIKQMQIPIMETVKLDYNANKDRLNELEKEIKPFQKKDKKLTKIIQKHMEDRALVEFDTGKYTIKPAELPPMNIGKRNKNGNDGEEEDLDITFM